MRRGNPSGKIGTRALMIGALLLSGLMSIGSASALTRAAASSSSSPSTATPGFPGGSTVLAIGNSMVKGLESSAQFQALSGGLAYYVNPYQSFGYTWGANIAPTERIIFFSSDGSAQIEADVYVGNATVQSMTYSSTSDDGNVRYGGSPNYGGYLAQYCGGTILGVCTGYSKIGEVYGTVQVPDSATDPSGDYTNGCCQFAEWTGVMNGSIGAPTYLTQGGIGWAGGHFSLPDMNSYNYSFFVEEVTSSSCGSPCNPTFFSPPSGFSGVSGDNIQLKTYIDANCGSGGDGWFEVWTESP